MVSREEIPRDYYPFRALQKGRLLRGSDLSEVNFMVFRKQLF